VLTLSRDQEPLSLLPLLLGEEELQPAPPTEQPPPDVREQFPWPKICASKLNPMVETMVAMMTTFIIFFDFICFVCSLHCFSFPA
jgi:hypothetical protein